MDYKSLRKINPEAARTAILQYLSSGSSISKTAKAFGIQRAVIYNILSKQSLSLRDKSSRPYKIANKTPSSIETMIISVQRQTGFGPKRLLKVLKEKRINIPYGTLRGILRRNK